MKPQLMELLQKIYDEGQEHDSAITIHEEQMLNITPDTGAFLSMLIQATGSKDVLEIGTSNGYSTLWLADAVSRMGGVVRTVEISDLKHTIANDNFRKSGLGTHIESVLQDARSFIRELDDSSVDFIFLDAERPQYGEYWQDLDRVLKLNRLLVVDNALSPRPEELVTLQALITGSGRYSSQVLRIGKGELVSLKMSRD